MTYTAEKCPCGHPSCRAGNLRPVTYGQGVMQMEEAEDLARKLNAYPKMLAFVQQVSLFSAFEVPSEDEVAGLRVDAHRLLEEIKS